MSSRTLRTEEGIVGLQCTCGFRPMGPNPEDALAYHLAWATIERVAAEPSR